MPFAFLPEDTDVEAALRRIAREQATEALVRAREGGGEGMESRVHGMRKAVKKLRGLLRLVRPVMQGWRAENEALRDAGRGLSSLRDAAVLLGTAGRLAEGMEEPRREALLAPLRAEAEAQGAAAPEGALPAFAEAMEALLDRLEDWRLRASGWEALEPGLAATWEGARATLRAAEAAPDEAEALHEWRKRVKDHWYQARLLAPIWPEMMEPHVAAADALGETLGEVNDLAVLAERLAALDVAPDLAEEALTRAAALRAERLALAFPLGRRLFAGRSEHLLARWRVWWERRAA
ncbi:CHAD domain-containing protein [Rubellimicrobium sp. CFH 75288]|uniref:CHAD domain-containing protein n=1 Tax=Rubellimicrobium sp. CFH 75288 TaxID=2697034 RepID=UPI00141314C0|nr:CHAD domain-containing protein [Rubellimicrobium sp. CFH 75288]NAZ37491.1 CHAD domain-containing protein [Rubellimicrobium sp. CFH 75288]